MCAEQGIALRGHTEQYSSNDTGINLILKEQYSEVTFLQLQMHLQH